MSVLDKYSIVQVRLDGIPQIPYEDGVGGFRGVCGHATANYGSGAVEDAAMNERNWEQGHWNDAFVHYFCDYGTVLDVADDNYISYGCSGGNPYFVNVELCQTKDEGRFAESYDRWVWLLARILYKHKLGVVDGKTLVSHRWVSQNYSGTHDDPHAYIESHGKNWDDVVVDVANYYNQFQQEEEVMLDKGVADTVINTWLAPSWQQAHDAGNQDQADYIHWLANEIRKSAGIPTN